jgi:uncharacterized protein YktB (UPF0637 family)
VSIPGFIAKDFDVFTIPGLQPRMDSLIQEVRPKLQAIGEELSPFLSSLCGEEMFPHVARHARRTINPPNDTWVAWSSSKKGYKALPHFQVGLWSSHLFIQFAVIYECTNKVLFAKQLSKELTAVKSAVPGNFYWSGDHMQPDSTLHSNMTGKEFKQLISRLKTVKNAEILCGKALTRDDPAVADGERLHEEIASTFQTLEPLYRLAFA